MSRNVHVVFLLLVVLGAGVLSPTAAAASGDEQGDAAGPLDGLTVPLHTILLLPPAGDPAADTWQVVELIRLYNPQSTAVDTAIIPLFSGASELELWSGFDEITVQVSEGVIQADLVMEPGSSHTFGIAYRLSPRALPTSLVRAIAHPTEQILVLLPQGSIAEPLADSLEYVGADAFGDRDVDVYTVEAVAPVSEWILGIRDKEGSLIDAATAPVPVIDRRYTGGQGAWLLVLVTLALAAGGALVSLFIRWWRQRQFPIPPVTSSWSEDTAGQLVSAAARLEQAYLQGRISSRTYQYHRRRLVKAWRQLHATDGK